MVFFEAWSYFRLGNRMAFRLPIGFQTGNRRSITEYSRHPNTELSAVFGLNLMPVSIIRISDHLKSGLCVRFARLDRFGLNKIFVLLIKRSRLAENFWSGFQMVAAIFFTIPKPDFFVRILNGR
jgi:hypothetical protein